MPHTPINPGEVLADELEEIGLSVKKLAAVIDVPPIQRIPKRSETPEPRPVARMVAAS